MGFRGRKSRVRYAKTENRLLEASGHIDFDAEKTRPYETFFWTLQQVWAPSDFSTENVNNAYGKLTFLKKLGPFFSSPDSGSPFGGHSGEMGSEVASRTSFTAPESGRRSLAKANSLKLY